MKKAIKLLTLLLCLVLSVTLFAACGGPVDDGEDDGDKGWTPTGADVTLAVKGEQLGYTVVFSTEDDMHKTAAVLFKSTLSGNGLSAPNAVYSAT